MDDLSEELAAHGFEIVKDDTGEILVKLVFMDENDEATGYALVTPEDAKRIISGEATLQNVLDDEGKQVLTLAPADGAETTDCIEPHPTTPVMETASDPSVCDVQIGNAPMPCATDSQKEIGTLVVPQTEVSDAIARMESSKITVGDTIDTDAESAHPMTPDSNVEQFTLSEQTMIADGNPTQVVTLVDAQGRILDQKHGSTGEQVMLEMHGQMLSYELQGPSASGEAITSTLLVSSSESPTDEMAIVETHPTTSVPLETPAGWSAPPPTGSAVHQDTEDVPTGQRFTLTEATTIADGEALQAVILTDDNGNVLDQKQGRTGEHVIIEMSGNSLEYVFLGPTENGEAITTTLMVTTEPESSEMSQSDVTLSENTPELSEAVATVADWCPVALPPEFYAALCRQVETLITTRIPRNSDGSPVYRPEPYHRKLGSWVMYQEMVDLFNSYQVGASRGETLVQYEILRNFAKIYRPSGPQSRALTRYEVAMNEAAAQICRYQPGLLFHKRELFHMAKDTVEQSQRLITSERRRALDNLSQFQSIATKPPVVKPQATSRPQAPQPAPPPPPPTTVVSGRVASSQLAMLESRGLSGIKQPSGSVPISSLPPISVSTSSEVALDRIGHSVTQSLSNTTSFSSNELLPKSRASLSDSSQYYAGVPIMKRDSLCKLTTSQDEALRAAVLSTLVDLPHFDLKPKLECTNIELSCWEQAKQLSSQIPSMDGSVENVSALLCNEKRLHSIRDTAALYGRPAGAMQFTTTSGLARSPPVTALMPYEIACNEAAAYLVSVVPQLLTHRRELSELAKKIVRNSGCAFLSTTSTDKMAIGGSGSGGYRFYCSDQLPELDLSAADQLLTDPLDRSDTPDSGCCLTSLDPEAEHLTFNFQTLTLSCEECNNVVDDVAIYTATGTDSLRKVRILNLCDCSFTGLMPIHLNQCCNLIELNLSGNALYSFPRCLHLPKLKRLNLRDNPRLLHSISSTVPIEPPLVEQFPRLVSLELDPPLVQLLSRQALACLCPYLKSINGEEFVEEPSDETVKALQTAKHELSALIYSKWEDDISGFYKKGIPKRDTIRVIETLVLHAVKRSVDTTEPFTRCKCILARRVAEDFLSPKMLDDDCEDDTAEKLQYLGEASDDDATETDSDIEGDSDLTSSRTDAIDGRGGLVSESVVDGTGVTDSVLKTKMPARRRSKKPVSAEATQESVAEREAEAAAANLTLLPDVPLDRLINVVGQAMRHGKTVVYAVIRTAARQPDGELIPVGGGLGVTSSNIGANVPTTKPTIVQSLATSAQYEDELSTVTDRVSSPVPKRISKPPSQPIQKSRATTPRRPVQQKASQQHVSQPLRKSNTVAPHDRRSALISRGAVGLPAPRVTTPPAAVLPVVTREQSTEGAVYTIQQRRLLPSDYIIRPSQSESEPAYVVPNVLPQPQPVAAWTPGRRGRPPLAHSVAKKAAAAEAEAAETSKLIENVPIPPPHSPPPPTMRMSTRDTNRLKRFSAYGVIDTAAALAGKEEALLAAALALEDERETDAARRIFQQSSVVLSEQDAAIAEAAVQRAREDAMVVLLGVNDTNWTVVDEPSVSSNGRTTPPPEEHKPREQNRGRKRRATEPSTTSTEQSFDSDLAAQSPVSTNSSKRTPRIHSPRPSEPKRTLAFTSTPVLPAVTSESTHQSVHSLSHLGSVVDYDPLHFIRCHARDNDPLDCKTKVWRCAFEPSLEDPNQTSNIVATCGGECVCLIDCRSGRVMKRFKHLNEEFYSLAWTTVEMAAGRTTNLLAAAGKLREIRLLHPEQLVCYAEMRGHKDDIACMIFHPEKPTILFSGDSKAMILVWDIGIPSAPEYRTRHQLLMRLTCLRPNLNPVLNLIFLPKYHCLIAGCEDGVFSWTFEELRKEKLTDERQPDLELKIPTRREPCFDGLAKLSDNLVVVKCVEEGEIYVFDYSQIIQRSRRLGTNKKTVNIEIRGQLRWQTTDEIYINLTARSSLHTVLCGDNEGTIWLYDLQKQVEEDVRRFKMKPVKILEWPECSIGGAKDEDAQMKESITSGFKNPVVNATDISHDGQYLVAVTDNNLVCIWKFSG